MNLNKTFFIIMTLLFYACSHADNQEKSEAFFKPVVDPDPPSHPLPPEESMGTIHLPPGFRLELVASEPMIEEPVAITWDGNGRMYVAEMHTYMQDVDGTGTNELVSRISLLEDTDGDGKMDKHSVFIDSLVLPRMILPVGDRLLVNETNTYDLWSYKDRDGDGKADEKINLYHNDEVDTRNMEHQASGLDWNLDNWMYVARSPVRYRFTRGKIEVDTLLDAPHSQWGVTHDDYGRIFFSLAGGEVPALGFQQNPAYGTLELSDQLAADFQATWPIISTPDVQGGLKRLREDSTLNHFTASCGQSIFRGDRLPDDMQGDLFICEPVGRLIRRAKVINQHGKTILKNAYDEQEFLASSDMNFRPVNTTTGPDGCLYIVDMYRGIIQESNWTREGSFLRPVVLRKGLDKNIGRGRIYRLVHEDYQPGPKPNMLKESSEALLQHLSHPNGWWRDNAQRLLILRRDTSVVPKLKEMALGEQSFFDKLFREEIKPIARLHALWTLEGLDALDKETVWQAMEDEDVQVRKAAIWISERYLQQGDAATLDRLATFQKDPSVDVRIQLILSLRYSKMAKAKVLIEQMIAQNAGNELLVAAGNKSLEEENEAWHNLKTRIARYRPGDRNLILKGANIFQQLCSACHGKDGRGIAAGGNSMIAPPLAGSERVNGDKEVLTRILLQGLSGPVDGKEYPDVMPAMGSNDDAWIASVLSYIRHDLGNEASIIHPRDVEAIRKQADSRKEYWTLKELVKIK